MLFRSQSISRLRAQVEANIRDIQGRNNSMAEENENVNNRIRDLIAQYINAHRMLGEPLRRAAVFNSETAEAANTLPDIGHDESLVRDIIVPNVKVTNVNAAIGRARYLYDRMRLNDFEAEVFSKLPSNVQRILTHSFTFKEHLERELPEVQKNMTADEFYQYHERLGMDLNKFEQKLASAIAADPRTTDSSIPRDIRAPNLFSDDDETAAINRAMEIQADNPQIALALTPAQIKLLTILDTHLSDDKSVTKFMPLVNPNGQGRPTTESYRPSGITEIDMGYYTPEDLSRFSSVFHDINDYLSVEPRLEARDHRVHMGPDRSEGHDRDSDYSHGAYWNRYYDSSLARHIEYYREMGALEHVAWPKEHSNLMDLLHERGYNVSDWFDPGSPRDANVRQIARDYPESDRKSTRLNSSH